jgi:hypothetical protein
MTIKSLKHHTALQPLFIIIGAGMVFVGAYIVRWVDNIFNIILIQGSEFGQILFIRYGTYSDPSFFNVIVGILNDKFIKITPPRKHSEERPLSDYVKI